MVIAQLIFDLVVLAALALLYRIVFNHLRNHRIANKLRQMYEEEQSQIDVRVRSDIWERLRKLEADKASKG